MNKFSFTGPDGKVYNIQGPDNATVEQARAVFEKQLQSGSLVGLKPGDVLSAVTQSAAGLSASLSQIGGPQGLTPSESQLNLRTVPVENPISVADFAKQRTPNFSLGPLSSSDLRALMAQSAAQVGQPATAISAQQGIGKFGLDIKRLESTGYVKPGTAQSYARLPAPLITSEDIAEAEQINASGGNTSPEQVAKNRQLTTFLSPAVFTGKSGAVNLKSIVNDDIIQDTIQGEVLKQNFEKLSQSGLTNRLKDPTQLSAALQTASTFDIKTAENLVKGLGIDNVAEVKSVARAAEFAKSLSAKFADSLIAKSPLETSIKIPKVATNTVDRSTVDASLVAILGNSKIPVPTFTTRTGAGLPGLDDIRLPRP